LESHSVTANSFLEFVDFFTTDLVTGFNKRKTTTPKEKTRK